MPISHNISANPALYKQLPTDYNRVAVPQYVLTSYLTVLFYGLPIYYGYDYDDLFFGGPGNAQLDLFPTPTKAWDVMYVDTTIIVGGQSVFVPANSLVIYQYDNTYTWLLDYNVPSSDCPYCGGTNVKNDLILSATGQLQLVYDIDKLSQQVLKSIITKKGKNSYFPNYGTTLADSIGTKIATGWTLRSQIVEQLETIKQYQNAMLASNASLYTARELLDDLLGVKAIPTADPRNINLTVTIVNRALETANAKTLRIN